MNFLARFFMDEFEFDCPSCGQRMLESEKRCKHCNYLAMNEINARKMQRWAKTITTQIVTVVIVALVIYFKGWAIIYGTVDLLLSRFGICLGPIFLGLIMAGSISIMFGWGFFSVTKKLLGIPKWILELLISNMK